MFSALKERIKYLVEQKDEDYAMKFRKFDEALTSRLS